MKLFGFTVEIMAWLYMIGIVFIISYLIGSIPTGYLIVKAKTGKDIRDIGSGSTGATNVKRVLGTPYFFIVMLLDAVKGMIPDTVIGRKALTRLRVYAGAEHKHAAQKPEAWEL